jgi:hypothetical protein
LIFDEDIFSIRPEYDDPILMNLILSVSNCEYVGFFSVISGESDDKSELIIIGITPRYIASQNR